MNRFFWLILIILLSPVFACSSPNSKEPDAQSPPSPIDAQPDIYSTESDTGENIAVYLIQGEPQIPFEDLSEHPEILVVTTFTEFQKAASTEIQLWIDKEAVDLVDVGWLRSEPQKYYPLVFVGYNDPSRVFAEFGRHFLTGRIILDLESNQSGDGFSVDIPLQNKDYPDRPGFPAFIRGYDWVPSSQSILDIVYTVSKTKSLVIDIYEREYPENGN